MLMRSAFPLQHSAVTAEAGASKRQTGRGLLHRQYTGVEQHGRDADRV
jgi:hypothetical protein